MKVSYSVLWTLLGEFPTGDGQVEISIIPHLPRGFLHYLNQIRNFHYLNQILLHVGESVLSPLAHTPSLSRKVSETGSPFLYPHIRLIPKVSNVTLLHRKPDPVY